MVISLKECIARPDEGSISYSLVEHLETVARATGSPVGDPVARCCFLAGLLHDAGKAQLSWQKYIRSVKKT